MLGWLRNRAMTSRVAEILAELEVNVPNLHAPVGLLSGGQRQAIAVARAVTFATRLVILDEPTAALGVRETRNVLRVVKRLPERGVSVIIISHNLEQVAEVADRVMVLRRGAKVGEAPPDAEHHEPDRQPDRGGADRAAVGRVVSPCRMAPALAGGARPCPRAAVNRPPEEEEQVRFKAHTRRRRRRRHRGRPGRARGGLRIE